MKIWSRSLADEAKVHVPTLATDEDCALVATMVNYNSVSLNFPFFCELRPHCVLTDTIERTETSAELDALPPDFLIALDAASVHFHPKVLLMP